MAMIYFFLKRSQIRDTPMLPPSVDPYSSTASLRGRLWGVFTHSEWKTLTEHWRRSTSTAQAFPFLNRAVHVPNTPAPPDGEHSVFVLFFLKSQLFLLYLFKVVMSHFLQASVILHGWSENKRHQKEWKKEKKKKKTQSEQCYERNPAICTRQNVRGFGRR